MSLYKMFETDKEKEINGIILEFGLNSKGETIKFRIARACNNNINYVKVLEQETRPYSRVLSKLPVETERNLNIRVFVRSLLIGWEGVEDKQGNPLTYNQENAIQLMNDLPDLFRDLQTAAHDAANYRLEEMEQQAKN